MNVLVSALLPRDDALPLAEPVQVGDVLRVRGRDRRVLQVSGTGPYVALVEYPLHVPLPAGEPVQVWRLVDGWCCCRDEKTTR